MQHANLRFTDVILSVMLTHFSHGTLYRTSDTQIAFVNSEHQYLINIIDMSQSQNELRDILASARRGHPIPDPAGTPAPRTAPLTE